MSVVYSADVFCDRCGDWVRGDAVGPNASGLARQALATARRAGWSRNVQSIYLDVCPSCLKEEDSASCNLRLNPTSDCTNQPCYQPRRSAYTAHALKRKET